MAIKVKLRTKAISGNRQGLYLTFILQLLTPTLGNQQEGSFYICTSMMKLNTRLYFMLIRITNHKKRLRRFWIRQGAQKK